MFWYERRKRQLRRLLMRRILKVVQFAATEAIAGIGIFGLAFCVVPLIFCAI